MADVSVQEARERARALLDIDSYVSIPDDKIDDVAAALARDVLALADENERLQAEAAETMRALLDASKDAYGYAKACGRAVAEAATLRQALERAQVFETEAELAAEITRLREAIASAMTSLATGPAKDGYAYSVLEEALAGTPARETTPDG